MTQSPYSWHPIHVHRESKRGFRIRAHNFSSYYLIFKILQLSQSELHRTSNVVKLQYVAIAKHKLVNYASLQAKQSILFLDTARQLR